MSTDSGLVANAPDVEAGIEQSRLFNADLAPVPPSRRKWGMLSFAALWISMSACIPTYMLASSLIGGGMNWWQAVLTIFLGNLIVLVPMILNAHAGTLYGIPFPVYCRASFGTTGANVPAVLRALVACGWFGIQSWIGGEAIYKICVTISGLHSAPAANWLGITGGQFLCFLFFWGINMWVIYRGIDTIRFLLNIKAPLLIALGLLLLAWAYRKAGGFGPILSQPSQFDAGQPQAGKFWSYFFPALTGMVGFWATLSLNIPDFSRYAKSQRDQVIGQALGLPMTMALYSFIGVAVTSATIIIFGQTIWDPVDVLTRFKNPVVLVLSMLALCLATLATNIAANVVSPANDFAHLAPRKISFRLGGLITGIIGVLMMPWKLVADPTGYIFTWLIAYSALLGPIGGILIADYFVCRRCRLNVTALYQADGEYRFTNGFSLVALIAFVVGALPSLPGFLVNVKVLSPESVPPFLAQLYNYAWFIGFAVAFTVYLALRKFTTKHNRYKNQHFVSQVLLRRFMVSKRLQCYNVKTGKWSSERPQDVFSEFGYNQLLVGGVVDNTLEDAFQKVESQLPKTIKALKTAAKTSVTELPPQIYENMCWYCAFIHHVSPFAKAAAPVDFVKQIDLELQHGKSKMLRDVLNYSEETIETFRKEYSIGRKAIIDSKDFLQLVYRIQFQLRYRETYMTFRHFTDWTICNSPIEFPVSDIALVPLGRDDFIYHILPIGPKLLLKGKIKRGQSQSSSQLNIKSENLTADEAEYWLDTICLSAVTQMICKHRIHDIPMVRERAKKKGISFLRLVDPDAVISAGVKNFNSNFGLRHVSVEEYVKFVHSFAMPVTTPHSSAA